MRAMKGRVSDDGYKHVIGHISSFSEKTPHTEIAQNITIEHVAVNMSVDA